MRRLFIASLTYVLLTGAAFANDWSGVHIGGHLGGTWASVDYLHNETFGGGIDDNINSDPSGVSGGLQVGAQQQFGSIIVGAEFAYTFLDIDEAVRSPGRPNTRDRITLLDNMWTIAARLGYVHGPWLGYIKAGYARSEIDFQNVRLSDGVVLGSSSDDVGGYLLGAGFEYALGRGLTLGADYSYINFNVDDQQQMRNGVAVQAINEDIDADVHQLSVRLNYRFNWGDRGSSMK